MRSSENFVDGVVSDGDDKTVGYTYNGAGMTSLTAYLTGGGGQTTGWLYYTVSQANGSAVDSKDLVGTTQWPDETLGLASSAQQESLTLNALGQTLTVTDRNGTVHTLTYDVLGRVVSDAVTTLGSGVDGAVRRIETAYDGQGNAYKVTSYDAASAGSVVNEVLRAFNGLGQLTAEYQSHAGAVNTGTSPKVQYTWTEMPAGANHSRLTSVTYPDGYVLTHNYASGLNGSISRLSSLSDTTGTLEGYEYLGLGGVVVRSHPQPDVDLSYVKRSGESDGAAGDKYTGLDMFGRVIDQRWLDPTSGAATDRFQYAYDLLGNRLYRDNLVNTAFGELYGYDAMSQLVSFDRGTLNGTRTGLTGAASRAQDWDYDAVGNFDSVTTNGTAQTRTANRQNEITSIGGLTTPTYDINGNMTGDETGKQFVYDAWNRMVAVKSSGGTTTLKTYSYDGLNRRVAETAGGTTTDLFYSADWQVLAEKVGANFTQRYVWSPVYVDAMVLRDRDTNADGTLDERLWVQQDANWNVTALVNGNGVVVERYVYDPYGVRTVYDASYTVRSGGSSYDFQHGFQGTVFDAVAGLNRTHTRPYSPTLARFTGPDWIRFAGGDVNLYRFVGNGPTTATDPSGLLKEEFGAATTFGILTAKLASDLAKIATAEAGKRYDQASLNDGPGDAFRHCVWAALMATHKDLQPGVRVSTMPEPAGAGPSHTTYVLHEFAYDIGRFHELHNRLNGQPQIEYAMDMHNNRVGLTIGASLGIGATVEQICKECEKALADKRLIWLVKGETMMVLSGRAGYREVSHVVFRTHSSWCGTSTYEKDVYRDVETDIYGRIEVVHNNAWSHAIAGFNF